MYVFSFGQVPWAAEEKVFSETNVPLIYVLLNSSAFLFFVQMDVSESWVLRSITVTVLRPLYLEVFHETGCTCV